APRALFEAERERAMHDDHADGDDQTLPDRKDRHDARPRALPAASADRAHEAEPGSVRSVDAPGGGAAAGGSGAGRRLQAARSGDDAGLGDAARGGDAARRDGAVGDDAAAQPGPLVDDDAGGGAGVARALQGGPDAGGDCGAVLAAQELGEPADRPDRAPAPGAVGVGEAGGAAPGVGAAAALVAPGQPARDRSGGRQCEARPLGYGAAGEPVAPDEGSCGA